mgnify:CR=1 FL=1
MLHLCLLKLPKIDHWTLLVNDYLTWYHGSESKLQVLLDTQHGTFIGYIDTHINAVSPLPPCPSYAFHIACFELSLSVILQNSNICSCEEPWIYPMVTHKPCIDVYPCIQEELGGFIHVWAFSLCVLVGSSRFLDLFLTLEFVLIH